MIVFLVGATGAIGRPLIKQLVAAGHEVIGTTRSAGKAEQLRAAGAAALIVDARDTDALRRAIIAASPHVVIDQLTDLSDPQQPGGFDDWLRGTVALRRDVTPTLVDAAREGGALRVIAQSAAFMTAPVGPDILDESAPLYLDATLHDAFCLSIVGRTPLESHSGVNVHQRGEAMNRVGARRPRHDREGSRCCCEARAAERR